ncbi:hypothetical protein sp82g_66 [Bacillus phage SP82G]|nr:hypothetical protein sp82g_66 [Bacillus phage SP82G]
MVLFNGEQDLLGRKRSTPDSNWQLVTYTHRLRLIVQEV